MYVFVCMYNDQLGQLPCCSPKPLRHKLSIIYHIQQIQQIPCIQDRSDVWSRMPFLMALAQYHESLPDSQQARKQLVESVAYRFFMQVEQRPSPKVVMVSICFNGQTSGFTWPPGAPGPPGPPQAGNEALRFATGHISDVLVIIPST